MNWPTFQQLRYLVAVADAGTFGAAADEEFVSQPALSAQIKELERKLGAVMLERTPRGVLLTNEGAAVVERARTILREMDDLVVSSRADNGLLRGRVSLGVIPTLAPYVLPAFVQKVREAHPLVRLHIRELRTEDLLEELRRGAVNLGMLALPVPSAEFVTGEMFTDEFLLAVPEGHRLARGKGRVSLDVLRDEQVILLEEGHCLRQQAADACRLAFSEPSEVQATSMSALVQMVAAGLGVTLLPACAEKVEAGAGRGIVTRRFTGTPPSRSVGLVWRRTSPQGDVFRGLAG